MEYIRNWLKTILYMNVLLLVCDHLMQNTSYEKYLRFFSGFLMIFCLIRPLIDLAGAGQFLEASFLQNEIKNEIALISREEEFEGFEEKMKEKYEKVYEKQIVELAGQYNLEVKNLELRWKKEDSFLEEIDLEVKKKEMNGAEADLKSFREALIPFYHLEESNINIEMQE